GRNAPKGSARAVPRGRRAGDEQVSVWGGGGAQVRAERKPHCAAIGRNFKPDRKKVPQFMAVCPQTIHRFGARNPRILHRFGWVLHTVPAGLSTEDPQLSTVSRSDWKSDLQV